MQGSLEFSTLVELLQHRGLRQPDQRAYTFLTDRGTEAGHVTYAELDWQARAVAAVLQRLTVPGEPVLLLYPPGLEFLAAHQNRRYAQGGKQTQHEGFERTGADADADCAARITTHFSP